MAVKLPDLSQIPALTVPRSPAKADGVPPLNAGDRLSRAEFERRYEARPDLKKAELIEGVVHIPSPVRFVQHGQAHIALAGWLANYLAATPGVTGSDNVTVRLDYENEVQPDAFLRLDVALGGRSSITEDDYIAGAPELIVEIAASSVAYDMYDKRRVYARNGVQEYLVAQAYEQRVDWFALSEGVYGAVQPDANGVLRSGVFPGLWLPVDALWAGDLARMLQVLQQGLASEGHQKYVASLQSLIQNLPNQ